MILRFIVYNSFEGQELMFCNRVGYQNMEAILLRPSLTKDMSIQSFKDFYWLKEELQTFCRENGISASGSKIEIFDRIETFLLTGEIKKPIRKSKVNRKAEPQGELSLDTVIPENHRCSQQVRAFFKTVIPNFHFSTYIQNYFKNHIGKTYRDAAEAWYKEEERKTHRTRNKFLLNLSIINLFVIFLMIRLIKGKVEKKQLKLGIRLKNFQEAINTYLILDTGRKSYNKTKKASILQLSIRMLAFYYAYRLLRY